MSEVIYEIQSGRPAGEIRHRAIFAARSIAEAEHCRQNIESVAECWPGEASEDSWLWGPHVIQRENHPLNEDDTGLAEFWWDYCRERGIPLPDEVFS